MINGINHVTISVSDISRSIKFYSDLVGLKLIAKWPKGAYMLAGKQWIALNLEVDVIPSNNYDHIAFNVSETDYTTLVGVLNNAGVKTFKENTSGGNSFYFLDPDGHKLELHYNNIYDRLQWAKDIDWKDFEIVDDLL